MFEELIKEITKELEAKESRSRARREGNPPICGDYPVCLGLEPNSQISPENLDAMNQPS